MQERMKAFKQRFPQAEELGRCGMCNATRCTSPYLFAADVKPEEAQVADETWSPCLQEVALDAGTKSAQLLLLHGDTCCG
jgi:hypothetical protein